MTVLSRVQFVNKVTELSHLIALVCLSITTGPVNDIGLLKVVLATYVHWLSGLLILDELSTTPTTLILTPLLVLYH